MAELADKQVLDLLRRLYQLDEVPYWRSALELVVEALEGDGGLVCFMDALDEPLATVGEVPTIPALPPAACSGAHLTSEHVLMGARHAGAVADSLWVVAHSGPRPMLRMRAAALASNLCTAIDFAEKRVKIRPLSGRLSAPTPARLDAVADRLATLSTRATRCVLLAARGMTNTQISEYLVLAPGTVARSLQEAYRHFEVSGRHELDVAALLAQPKPPPVAS